MRCDASTDQSHLPHHPCTNTYKAFCNNIDESFGAPVKNTTHCARTAPVVMTGSKATQERPMIVLKEGLGFASPVVQLHNPINE